jgi:YVTN family beta-propeller protein
VAAVICPNAVGLCNRPSLVYFAIYVIDAVTRNVGIAVQGKGAVGGIAFSPDGKQTYVTNFEPDYYADPPLSSVLVLGGVGPSIPLPGFSQVSGIVITPDGTHAYVADTGSNSVWVIDTAKRAIVAALPVAGSGIAITPDGKHIYVGSSVIETATNTVVATLPVFGSGIAVTPDGAHVYLANMVIETTKNTVVATLPVTGNQWAIIPPPQGVPFIAFSAKLDIRLSSKQHQDAFDLESSFILSSKASNGIHPDIEPVKLQVGPFITTIPAGSFKQRQGRSYTYEGIIGGVRLAAKIDLTGTLRYRLHAKVGGADLSGITNPTQVSLSIGGGVGLASVKSDPASHGPPVLN